MSKISDAIECVWGKIVSACIRAGRSQTEIQLCGVSKFHSRAEIDEAFSAGLQLFGENRVQEATEKFAVQEKNGFQIHLIGGLQRNKAKRAVELFDCIQSVDRLSLIDELGALTRDKQSPLPILLEIHTAEDSKSGFPDIDSLLFGVERVFSYKGLLLQGLMTMAPNSNDEKSIRASFRAVAAAQKAVSTRFSNSCPILSMGMSNDFEIAIEEGSTMVRIGTAIFGKTRQK
ncbi:MAG: YggS family pyridoxal phosphate-dependent enzyme [Treponema sp.]|jgi:pyridoxal phosphate enzyme (YggS family)|nr:YggS family pyridoxal phosphate-dependent enzyme [Treponema sp.]